MTDTNPIPASSSTESSSAGGRLRRWAERKRTATTSSAVSSSEQALLNDQAESSAPDRSECDVAAALEVIDDTTLLLTDEDMPALETLDHTSDFSGFFNRGVSPELRRKALKYLFRQPALNIVDGLDDYDEDYTQFEPLGDTITCDMKFHQERLARLAASAEQSSEPLVLVSRGSQLEPATDESASAIPVTSEHSAAVDDESADTELPLPGDPSSLTVAAEVEHAETATAVQPIDLGPVSEDSAVATDGGTTR